MPTSKQTTKKPGETATQNVSRLLTRSSIDDLRRKMVANGIPSKHAGIAVGLAAEYSLDAYNHGHSRGFNQGAEWSQKRASAAKPATDAFLKAAAKNQILKQAIAEGATLEQCVVLMASACSIACDRLESISRLTQFRLAMPNGELVVCKCASEPCTCGTQKP